VSRAGLTVLVKRLPPKGVTRQVSIDVELAADIIAFALGHFKFSDLGEYKTEANAPRGSALPTAAPFMRMQRPGAAAHAKEAPKSTNGHEKKVPDAILEAVPPVMSPEEAAAAIAQANKKEKRMITLVCPSRDVSYAIALANELGVETTTADFGQFNTGDILKSAHKWIDLSDSETIWKD
jgi:hypothetical protein